MNMNSNNNQFLPGPGYDQYKVPIELFQQNRSKLANRLASSAIANTNPSSSSVVKKKSKKIVVLKGGISHSRYDTDFEPIFRQESYFWWLTGVKEPDCSIVISITIGGGSTGTGSTGTGTVGPTVRTVLFVPKLPAEYATIMGKIRSLEEWKNMYGVDDVLYSNEMDGYCGNYVYDDDHDSSSCQILLLKGPNTDSKSMYDEKTIGVGEVFPERTLSIFNMNNIDIDTTTLFPILADCRTIKSTLELQLMEHVTQITSFAHAYVMRNMNTTSQSNNNRIMYEYQCESLFKHYTYYNYGSRLTAYTSICGCGPNSAILHYGHTGEPNSRKIINEHDHCLFDMGAEYQCYASDITCSFPANGIFTPKYEAIYESVLNAQRAVYKLMAPGVSYVECHIAAELEIVKGLYKIGIVTIPDDEFDDDTTTIDTYIYINKKLEILVRDHRLGAVFMPHGLGHLIGIDAHDVGGYLHEYNDDTTRSNTTTTTTNNNNQQPLTPPRIEEPGLKSLRTARILQPNMVVTVEPGCYFIDHLLDEAFQPTNVLSKYLNKELINSEYRGYGGVRLEDVVTIISTKEKNKNNDSNINSEVNTSSSLLSSSNNKDYKKNNNDYYIHNFTLCPRTVKEIEYVMAGGKWPPMKDDAPELFRLKLTDANVSPLPSPPSI